MFEMILALVLFQMAVCVNQAILSMLINFVPFDNPLEGNVFTFFCLVLLTTFSGIFFGNSFVF